MQKFLICFCAILAVSSAARMAFKLAAGIENLIARVDTTFTCDDKAYGYYADVQNECKIFHVCFPVQNSAGKVKYMEQFSFICGNQTVFNQESLTCTNTEDAIACQDSTNLYSTINAEFGKIFRGRTGLGGQSQDQGAFATNFPNPPEDTTVSGFRGK